MMQVGWYEMIFSARWVFQVLSRKLLFHQVRNQSKESNQLSCCKPLESSSPPKTSVRALEQFINDGWNTKCFPFWIGNANFSANEKHFGECNEPSILETTTGVSWGWMWIPHSQTCVNRNAVLGCFRLCSDIFLRARHPPRRSRKPMAWSVRSMQHKDRRAYVPAGQSQVWYFYPFIYIYYYNWNSAIVKLWILQA